MTEKHEFIEVGTPIIFTDELAEVTLRNGVNRAYEQMRLNLNTSMYSGYNEAAKPLTRLQRWARRLRTYRERVADAWAVLTGKADIGDY